jgi:enoyl-CoA hydratase
VPIDYESTDDHIVWITIDRPHARNSLDMDHFAQLRGAWDRFNEDDEAWVAIVTGVGDAFCTGADLKTYIPQVTEMQRRMASEKTDVIDGYRLDDGVKAVLRGVKIYKPIIAAVNGVCVAGGMEMLGGCDLRVAVPEATFAVMEPKRGLFAGGGTTVRLPRQIAFPAAMEFLLCADRIPADRAFAMGLLNEIVPAEELRDAALRYAHRITANGPFAVRKTKESVLLGLATDMREAYKIESAISAEVFSSQDAIEGPKAFAEKRPPRWTGR